MLSDTRECYFIGKVVCWVLKSLLPSRLVPTRTSGPEQPLRLVHQGRGGGRGPASLALAAAVEEAATHKEYWAGVTHVLRRRSEAARRETPGRLQRLEERSTWPA